MKKFLQKKLKNEKGLTLVELLAVIVILGIIAAIAVPAIGNIIQNTREKAVMADAINAMEAANLYFVEHPDETEVSLKATGTGESLKEGLEPTYMKDSTLTSGTITKEDTTQANKMTITFEGIAGSKKVSATKITKAMLNDKKNVKIAAK